MTWTSGRPMNILVFGDASTLTYRFTCFFAAAKTQSHTRRTDQVSAECEQRKVQTFRSVSRRS